MLLLVHFMRLSSFKHVEEDANFEHVEEDTKE